jgi:hypothetical protein
MGSSVVSLSDGIGQGCFALVDELRAKLKSERGDEFKNIARTYGGHHMGASFEADFQNDLDASDTGYMLCKVEWNHIEGKPQFVVVMNWGQRAKPVSIHAAFDPDMNQSKFVAWAWSWLTREMDHFTMAVTKSYNR